MPGQLYFYTFILGKGGKKMYNLDRGVTKEKANGGEVVLYMDNQHFDTLHLFKLVSSILLAQADYCRDWWLYVSLTLAHAACTVSYKRITNK